MNWDDFYERFYDWADSTKLSRISSLESIGSEEDVYEIAMEYAYMGNKECTRFLKKAISLNATFSAANIIELMYSVDESFIYELAKHNNTPYSEDNIDELSVYLTPEQIKSLGLKESFTEDDDKDDNQKSGFFITLLGVLGIMGDKNSQSAHSQKCDGDCDNCPAHYGYRYGRWYYGHGHQRGCERGGNGGASGKCNRD